MSLCDELDRFNRKERYWVIRELLEDEKNPLVLSDAFRTKIESVTEFKIPLNPWWAIDYHLDWVVGALKLYEYNSNQTDCSRQVNDGIVVGNQEDIDLIISFDNVIIFIEAKCCSAWDENQLRSKLNRIKQVERRCKENNIDVVFEFIAMSPMKYKKNYLDQKWIELSIPEHFSMVVRCDEKEKSSAKGGYWKVKKVSYTRPIG